jgi:hypothetical protein
MVLFMDPQPYYKGRSLATWLLLYHDANQRFPADPEPAQALRAMGSRSLPYLVNWLAYERPPWKDKVLATLNGVPPPVKTLSTNLSTRLQKEWARRENGYRASLWGFGVLGRTARPAAAELGQLALRGKGPVADRAARVLIDMDTNAAPAIAPLINGLHSPDERVAARAIWLVQIVKCAWEPAVQPLITTAKEGNPKLRLPAIAALGSFGDTAAPAIPFLLEASGNLETKVKATEALMCIPSYALPKLTNQLQQAQGDEQRQAIKTLAALREQARPAVPVLLEASARNPYLGTEITNALLHIAPEIVPPTAPTLGSRTMLPPVRTYSPGRLR